MSGAAGARTRPRPDWSRSALRSLLFAPGDHTRRLERVGDFASDVVVLDLEDAVAPDRKDVARGMVREALPTYGATPILAARVNAPGSAWIVEDIAAVVAPDLDMVMVPKVETADELADVDRAIAATERAAGLPTGQLRVVALVETARGVAGVERLAADGPERLLTLAFGAADFAADMRLDLTSDATEILYARSRIALAARAAGLVPALDGPFLAIDDHDGLAADTLRSRQLGFQGRVVIHPGQVAAVQEAYASLDAETAASLQRIVTAFEHAVAEGVASLRVDGTFVDQPIYERARQRLLLHGVASTHS